MKWADRLTGLIGTIAVALTISACAPIPLKEGTGGYIDDTVITTKVKSKFIGNSSLKHSSEINVETFKGRVQLSGFVSSPQMAFRAVEIAREVPGVKSVINNMQIR